MNCILSLKRQHLKPANPLKDGGGGGSDAAAPATGKTPGSARLASGAQPEEGVYADDNSTDG